MLLSVSSWSETGLTDEARRFDPRRDGFGFRNPAGAGAPGSGLRRYLNEFVYGSGLCFGMTALALEVYQQGRHPGARLSTRPLEPALLDTVREYHARQFGVRAVFVTVWSWLRAFGGPGCVPARLRLPDCSDDPHILCFGPRPNRRALHCFLNAHAVAPYRLERAAGLCRVYVYDPNYPRDPGRYVLFRENGMEFRYGGFCSRNGWGIVLVPLSAVSGRRSSRSARPPARVASA